MQKLIKVMILISLALLNSAFAKDVYVHSVSGWDPDLSWDPAVIPGFSRVVTINQKSRLIVQGHIDVRHIGGGWGVCSSSVGVGFYVNVNGFPVPGSTTGQDMTHCGSDAYYAAYIHAYKILEPGTYTIEVLGRAYSSDKHVDGLAEVKGDGQYNEVLFIIEPIN